MGEISIKVGGRSFKLGCDDGEEAHLLVLAEHLSKHVDNLRATLGKTGDEQLFLMAGLMVCDELWDSRDELNKLEEKIKSTMVPPKTGQVIAPAALPKPAGKERAMTTPEARPATMPALAPHSAPIPVQRPKSLAKQT